MFNPSPPSRILHQELAKAPGFLPAQEAFHSSNLTSRFFFISVSFSRIAFAFCSRAQRKSYYTKSLSLCQAFFSILSASHDVVRAFALIYNILCFFALFRLHQQFFLGILFC